MGKLNLHPNIDREVKRGVAWAVHAFTTCGIVLGFLALVAVLKNDAVAAFMWLGLALFVDGIDGTLARKARVLEYTPNVDGRTLDNVIDFFTYVAVPALMVYWFNMTPVPGAFFVPQTWSLISAAAIMTSGACQAALLLMAEYTKGRQQFDKVIASFQAVSQRAGDAYIDTEGVRLTAWQAAWRLSEGLPAEEALLSAKFWAAEGGWRVMHGAHHVHGGVGVDRDYPLHRYFLLHKQLELQLGSAQPSLLRLGRLLVGS